MLPRAVPVYNGFAGSETISETFVGMRIWRSRRALEQIRSIVDRHGVSIDNGILVPVSTRRLSATLGVTVGTVLAMYDRLGPIVMSRDPLVVDPHALDLAEAMAEPRSRNERSEGSGDLRATNLRVIREPTEGHRTEVQRPEGQRPDGHRTAGSDAGSVRKRELLRVAPQVLVALGSDRPELAVRCLELLGLFLQRDLAVADDHEQGSGPTGADPRAARTDVAETEHQSARRTACPPAHRTARTARLESDSERDRELASLSLTSPAKGSSGLHARVTTSGPKPRTGPRTDREVSAPVSRDVRATPGLQDADTESILAELRGLRGGIEQLNDRGLIALCAYTPVEIAAAVVRLNANPRVRSPIGVMVAAAMKGERQLFAVGVTTESTEEHFRKAAGSDSLAGDSADMSVGGPMGSVTPSPAPMWAMKAISLFDETALAELDLRWSTTLAGKLAAADPTLTDDEKLERLAIFLAVTSGADSGMPE